MGLHLRMRWVTTWSQEQVLQGGLLGCKAPGIYGKHSGCAVARGPLGMSRHYANSSTAAVRQCRLCVLAFCGAIERTEPALFCYMRLRTQRS